MSLMIPVMSTKTKLLHGAADFSIESSMLFGKNFENDLNNYPIAKEPKVALQNNHLQYSITWGMLAVIFLIMNYIYLRKNK